MAGVCQTDKVGSEFQARGTECAGSIPHVSWASQGVTRLTREVTCPDAWLEGQRAVFYWGH